MFLYTFLFIVKFVDKLNLIKLIQVSCVVFSVYRSNFYKYVAVCENKSNHVEIS